MSMREQKEVQKVSHWKRVGIAAVVGSAVIFSCAVSAYATSGSHGANTQTATTGASTATAGDSTSTSGANNNIKVERGAAYSAPSIGHAAEGTEVVQFHTFLGGVTLANTEMDARIRMKTVIIIDAYKEGLISENAAKARIYLALEDMDDVQKPRQVPVLGLLGVSCNQRSLYNGLGLLCN